MRHRRISLWSEAGDENHTHSLCRPQRLGALCGRGVSGQSSRRPSRRLSLRLLLQLLLQLLLLGSEQQEVKGDGGGEISK